MNYFDTPRLDKLTQTALSLCAEFMPRVYARFHFSRPLDREVIRILLPEQLSTYDHAQAGKRLVECEELMKRAVLVACARSCIASKAAGVKALSVAWTDPVHSVSPP